MHHVRSRRAALSAARVAVNIDRFLIAAVLVAALAFLGVQPPG